MAIPVHTALAIAPKLEPSHWDPYIVRRATFICMAQLLNCQDLGSGAPINEIQGESSNSDIYEGSLTHNFIST